MTNEEYLDALRELLIPVRQKYIDMGRVSPGGTITAMKNRLQSCLNDIDGIDKDMVDVVNKLKNDNDVIITEELTELIKVECMNTLRGITNYRLVNVLPD